MKLVRATFERDGTGEVQLIPMESEDMWHAFNLITAGDRLTSSTVRKVKNESATGSSDTQRVRTNLTVEILTVDFDTEACVLRVKGRNTEENRFVKQGAHHTLQLELHQKFTLAKDLWDSVARERVETACDPGRAADVAAVVMQEGLAHVCLLTPSMTLTRARIETPIPRKRRGSCAQHDRAIERFYDQIIDAVLRHIKFDVIKCVLVASPGFVREQFLEYMFKIAIARDVRVLIENRSKFVSAHSSSGHKHAIEEVLLDPGVAAQLKDTKAAAETQALREFHELLRDQPDRAVYGFRHVSRANDAVAIDRLLVTDSLFRSSSLPARRRFVALVDAARDNGAHVHVFSSLHVSGEQLAQLSGIAAILRFPLAGLDDDDADADADADIEAEATAAAAAESDGDEDDGEDENEDEEGDEDGDDHAGGAEAGRGRVHQVDDI